MGVGRDDVARTLGPSRSVSRSQKSVSGRPPEGSTGNEPSHLVTEELGFSIDRPRSTPGRWITYFRCSLMSRTVVPTGRE